MTAHAVSGMSVRLDTVVTHSYPVGPRPSPADSEMAEPPTAQDIEGPV